MDLVKGDLGQYGTYDAAVDASGVVTVSVGVKLDLLVELQKLALKTDNSIDDKLVQMVASALGRTLP